MCVATRRGGYDGFMWPFSFFEPVNIQTANADKRA